MNLQKKCKGKEHPEPHWHTAMGSGAETPSALTKRWM